MILKIALVLLFPVLVLGWMLVEGTRLIAEGNSDISELILNQNC